MLANNEVIELWHLCLHISSSFAGIVLVPLLETDIVDVRSNVRSLSSPDEHDLSVIHTSTISSPIRFDNTLWYEYPSLHHCHSTDDAIAVDWCDRHRRLSLQSTDLSRLLLRKISQVTALHLSLSRSLLFSALRVSEGTLNTRTTKIRATTPSLLCKVFQANTASVSTTAPANSIHRASVSGIVVCLRTTLLISVSRRTGSDYQKVYQRRNAGLVGWDSSTLLWIHADEVLLGTRRTRSVSIKLKIVETTVRWKVYKDH